MLQKFPKMDTMKVNGGILHLIGGNKNSQKIYSQKNGTAKIFLCILYWYDVVCSTILQMFLVKVGAYMNDGHCCLCLMFQKMTLVVKNNDIPPSNQQMGT